MGKGSNYGVYYFSKPTPKGKNGNGLSEAFRESRRQGELTDDAARQLLEFTERPVVRQRYKEVIEPSEKADVVSEVLEKVLPRWREIEPGEVEGYVATAVQNVVRDTMREKSRRQTYEVLQDASHGESYDDGTDLTIPQQIDYDYGARETAVMEEQQLSGGNSRDGVGKMEEIERWLARGYWRRRCVARVSDGNSDTKELAQVMCAVVRRFRKEATMVVMVGAVCEHYALGAEGRRREMTYRRMLNALPEGWKRQLEEELSPRGREEMQAVLWGEMAKVGEIRKHLKKANAKKGREEITVLSGKS